MNNPRTRDPIDALNDAQALQALAIARDAGAQAPFDVNAPYVSYWLRRTNDAVQAMTTTEQVAHTESLVRIANETYLRTIEAN